MSNALISTFAAGWDELARHPLSFSPPIVGEAWREYPITAEVKGPASVDRAWRLADSLASRSEHSEHSMSISKYQSVPVSACLAASRRVSSLVTAHSHTDVCFARESVFFRARHDRAQVQGTGPRGPGASFAKLCDHDPNESTKPSSECSVLW